MKTTDQEKSRLREIIQHLIDNDQVWIDSFDIDAKNKGIYWILNYRQGSDNPYNRLVRGLVVEKPSKDFNGDLLSLIKSFPFMRFFNKQEEGKADFVDLSNAEMIEKLDGSMVGVFFPEGDPSKPSWHTRKMLSTAEEDMALNITTFHGGKYNFLSLIGEYVQKLNWNKDDVDYTYVFEFLHDATYVWTKYNAEMTGLHLLGCRRLSDHLELDEEELDEVASSLGVGRPRRWNSVDDANEIENVMKQCCVDTAGFEGFVFRDRKTGARVKLKDTEYVKFHHMLDKLSYKNLVGKVIEGEESEIIAYFPSAEPRIATIKELYVKFVDRVIERVNFWKSKNLSRKNLALQVFGENGESDRWIASSVMRLHDKDCDLREYVENTLKKLTLGEGKQAGSPKKLLELIGLHDVELEGESNDSD